MYIVRNLHFCKSWVFVSFPRYKEFEDGIFRLQTVRFESMQLSQQMAEGDESQLCNSPHSPEEDSPSASVDSPEVQVNSSEKETNITHGNEYHQLLQQYEQHEYQLAETEADGERHEGGGPVRRAHTSVRMYPYQRPQSPDSLDVPQTLLALQHATVHLPSGES